MNEVEWKEGQRVWVQGEESWGRIVDVDVFCESAEVVMESDGVTVNASWHQLRVEEPSND